MKAVIFSIAGLAMLLASSGSIKAGEDSARNFVDQLIGDWQGEAVAYYPRRPERATRHEQVSMRCEAVLEGAYVQCHSRWRQADGTTRQLLTYFNVHAEAPPVEILYLYHDWPGKVMYRMQYDAQARTLSGGDSYDAPGGVPARERVEWYLSEDGKRLRSTEWNHWETDPGDQWMTSFEFTLQSCTGTGCRQPR